MPDNTPSPSKGLQKLRKELDELDNTPSWGEAAKKLVDDIIHIGYVNGYNQLVQMANVPPYNHIEPMRPEEAISALNSAVKELVKTSEPGLGADPKRLEQNPLEMAEYKGYCEGVQHYQANIIKAIEGKAE